MFYIGATISLKGFEFSLTDADEFTLNYMESHPSEYPMANISSIMNKIREKIRGNYKDFIGKYLDAASITDQTMEHDGLKICYDMTAKALKELLDDRITEHEIVTFLRYFSADKLTTKSNELDRFTIQSVIQMTLNTKFWDDIESLREYIYDVDPKNHNGFMQPNKLRTIIKGCRLPLKEVIIDDMFSV